MTVLVLSGAFTACGFLAWGITVGFVNHMKLNKEARKFWDEYED